MGEHYAEAKYIEEKYMEVNCRSNPKGEDFTKGVKDYKFSIGPGYAWLPNRSFFKIGLKITFEGVVPTEASCVTFADDVCGTLFNNIYLNAGGQTISSITNGCPQISILKSRLSKNASFNKSIGEAQGLGGHWLDRLRTTVNIGGDPESIKYRNQTGRNQRDFIWQPPLGAMEVSMMGPGEYEFQLNGSQDYQLAGVDTGYSKNAITLVGDDENHVNLEVTDLRLYVCMARADMKPSGEEVFDLKEYELVSTNVSNGNGQINQELTVPSSTCAIAMFLQDSQAGKRTDVPPTKFDNRRVLVDGAPTFDAMTLRDYQISYANQTKPPTRVNSLHTEAVDELHQRYISTMIQSGLFFRPSGAETYAEYLERGVLVYENFLKSSDNMATRLNVIANYDRISADCRLFIAAEYTRTVKITRQNGLIVQVQSQNI